MLAWWHGHTRVSSNRKDVVKKGRGLQKRGETHPKHYLTIRQVCLRNTIKNLCCTLSIWPRVEFQYFQSKMYFAISNTHICFFTKLILVQNMICVVILEILSILQTVFS